MNEAQIEELKKINKKMLDLTAELNKSSDLGDLYFQGKLWRQAGFIVDLISEALLATAQVKKDIRDIQEEAADAVQVPDGSVQ